MSLFSHEKVKAQTRIFIETQVARFNTMTEDEFENTRSRLLRELKQRSLREEASDHWLKITSGDMNFRLTEEVRKNSFYLHFSAVLISWYATKFIFFWTSLIYKKKFILFEYYTLIFIRPSTCGPGDNFVDFATAMRKHAVRISLPAILTKALSITLRFPKQMPHDGTLSYVLVNAFVILYLVHTSLRQRCQYAIDKFKLIFVLKILNCPCELLSLY